MIKNTKATQSPQLRSFVNRTPSCFGRRLGALSRCAVMPAVGLARLRATRTRGACRLPATALHATSLRLY